MPSVHNVRHVRLVYRWRKSAEPGSSIHLIHYPSIPDHLTDALRTSQKPCCRANTLECQACIADVSEEEFCRRKPHSHVCPQKPDNKPSHPDNCYSSIWNTEI